MTSQTIISKDYVEYDINDLTAMRVMSKLGRIAEMVYEDEKNRIYNVKEGLGGRVLLTKAKDEFRSFIKVIMRAVEPKTRAELESIIKPIKPVLVI